MRKLSKTMNAYLSSLHKAEFESGEYHDSSNPSRMVELLNRALTWKKMDNLQAVCIYLGAECDDRIETRDGCKEIITEDRDHWKKQIK